MIEMLKKALADELKNPDNIRAILDSQVTRDIITSMQSGVISNFGSKHPISLIAKAVNPIYERISGRKLDNSNNRQDDQIQPDSINRPRTLSDLQK
jgi:hypothetical protein